MDNLVFITTRYSFIISRQNMEGFFRTQDWGITLTNQRRDSMSQVSFIFISDYLFTTLVINPGYIFGHHDPSDGKPPGHFQLLVCRKSLNKPLRITNILYPKHGGLTVLGRINMRDGIADQVFELAYYKAF